MCQLFWLFSLSLGDHPEPSRKGQSGLLSSPGLPHHPCDLSLCWAEGEAWPPHGQETRGPAADTDVWRRCYRQAGSHQANVCGELLHIPSLRYVSNPLVSWLTKSHHLDFCSVLQLTLCFPGRFAARDLKQTVAVGVIKSVEKDKGSKLKAQVCK